MREHPDQIFGYGTLRSLHLWIRVSRQKSLETDFQKKWGKHPDQIFGYGTLRSLHLWTRVSRQKRFRARDLYSQQRNPDTDFQKKWGNIPTKSLVTGPCVHSIYEYESQDKSVLEQETCIHNKEIPMQVSCSKTLLSWDSYSSMEWTQGPVTKDLVGMFPHFFWKSVSRLLKRFCLETRIHKWSEGKIP